MSTATKPATPVLNATKRESTGKGVARALRREGKIPGVLYGIGQKPVSLALSENQVTLEYNRGRFRSRLVDLSLDGKNVKALPKDVQFHPVSDRIEHVDFIQVQTGVKLHVQVPVKFSGSDKSPGIKRGGVLNIVRHEIDMICTPEAIPMFIEVDVSKLEIGGSIHINDIKLPAGVTPELKRNFTVATVAGRSATMEEEAKPAAAATTAEGAAAPADGAAAATGAAAPAADAGKKDEAKKPEGKK